MMRVITGSARGRRLRTLEGLEVRPTTDKVKEAIFSKIQFEIEGRKILDLFAGSGQMGIEALSRGAAKAVFVDSSRDSAEVVRENLKTTNLAEKSVCLLSDYKAYLSGKPDVFDVVFLDPPYNKGLAADALECLSDYVSASGVVVCETAFDEQLPDKAGGLIKGKSSKYGKIAVTLYRKGEV